MKVALLYEHPTWSVDLIDRMHDRGVDVTPIDVGELDFAIPSTVGQHDLWINRVNAMPSDGRSPSVVAATGHFLLSLELAGARVVNGSRTHQIGGSKAAQAALFAHLGLETPASIAIHTPSDAIAAAEQLGYPVLTKPNIGGSGSGIALHPSHSELQRAVAEDTVDLGIDGTGLVQRLIDSADNTVYRIEMLGSELFYGTRQSTQPGVYNYCAADGCAVGEGPATIDLFTPSPDLVAHAARILAAASTHVGGVEYMIDRATGAATFYDFNPYSNFISGYEDQLGFDPIDRYLDFVLTQ